MVSEGQAGVTGVFTRQGTGHRLGEGRPVTTEAGGVLLLAGLHRRPTGREASLGQSPRRTSGDRPHRPVHLRLLASRLGEDGGPLREPLRLSDRLKVAVGSSPRTVQAHPAGPTPSPRPLRAWALPRPWGHCRALAGGQRKCPPRFQTGLPPGQPPSDSPLPSSSPVLNGILDNQSVRPSAQLGK